MVNLNTNERSSIVPVSALVALATLAGCQNAEKQAEMHTTGGCHTEMVAMRDGARLATDIYDPGTPGRHPVVLMRTPYGASYGAGCGSKFNLENLGPYIRDGYVGVVQETRGTSRSEGRLTPFVHEQNDGYDAVEWAATQPWSNGKVGMVGGSYLGVTQWQAAAAHPPHLASIAPWITPADYHDDWIYRNGVFDPMFTLSWVAYSAVPDQMARSLTAEGASENEIQVRAAEWKAKTLPHISTDWLEHLPLSGGWNPEVAKYAPFYDEWLKHPAYDAFWKQIDVGQHWNEVSVPALISGAWYDLFAVGTIDTWWGMRDHAGTEAARDGLVLAMSWGGHVAQIPPAPGEITWGADPSDKTLAKRFVDHYLRGDPNGIEREPRVQLVVLVPPDHGTEGSSFLYRATDFPAPGTRLARYYLASGGNANSSRGDGRLVDGGSSGRNDHFVYNPNHPVPTRGGNDGGVATVGGAFDQSEIETRSDVLVYKSAPLADEIAVIGPVTVSFWAKSSARDTDFTAKLVDVHPDGFAHNVVDRIIRARLRRGSRELPELIKPGQAYSYTLNLGSTATILRKGHRVLLEISSSNVPHYARNLNTGLSNEDTATAVTAHQTILHDKSHPSYVELPVVPGVKAP